MPSSVQDGASQGGRKTRNVVALLRDKETGKEVKGGRKGKRDKKERREAGREGGMEKGIETGRGGMDEWREDGERKQMRKGERY